MFSGRTLQHSFQHGHRPSRGVLRVRTVNGKLSVQAVHRPEDVSHNRECSSSSAAGRKGFAMRSGWLSGVFQQSTKASFAFTLGLNAVGGGGPGAGGDGKGYGGGGGGDGSAFSYGSEASANVLADLSLSEGNDMVEEVIILDVSGQQATCAPPALYLALS
jgi:hypothetical protein